MNVHDMHAHTAPLLASGAHALRTAAAGARRCTPLLALSDKSETMRGQLVTPPESVKQLAAVRRRSRRTTTRAATPVPPPTADGQQQQPPVPISYDGEKSDVDSKASAPGSASPRRRMGPPASSMPEGRDSPGGSSGGGGLSTRVTGPMVIVPQPLPHVLILHTGRLILGLW